MLELESYGAEGTASALLLAARAREQASWGHSWWFVFCRAPPAALPATLFVKESYVLCRIYWLYLESIFSKGTVADISSPILSWSVERSEATVRSSQQDLE